MGIRDKPIAAGSPWQNSFAERLIGTVRRETRHAPKEVKDGAMLSALQVDVAGKRHQAVVEVSPAREPFLAIAPFSQDYW